MAALIATLLTNFSELYNSSLFTKARVIKRSRSYADEELAALVAAREEKQRLEKAKILNYVEKVVPLYSDEDFRQHFRLYRSTVEYLVNILPRHDTGKPSLELVNREKVILLSLWTLGNRESFRGIADRFGLGKSHAYRVFMNFCEDMNTLRSDFIVWPRGGELEEVKKKFTELRGWKSFPNVVGCVDGTLIKVTVPNRVKQEYYCRKQFTAVVMQGLCDSELMFRDVFAGWPGSAHDARVWRNSPLYKAIEENPDMVPGNSHILGDSAYPLKTYLIVPYKDNGHLSRKEKLFNQRLSSSRVVIEQAYGHLYGRFRRLVDLQVFVTRNATTLIITAAILHNLCILQKDTSPDYDDSYHTNDDMDIAGSAERSAVEKRDLIADEIFAEINE